MLAHIDSQSIWQLDLFASVVIQNNLSLITFIMEHQGKLWKEHKLLAARSTHPFIA